VFELASRLKVRYDTIAGVLSPEDLWDLPLSSDNDLKVTLDALAKKYSKYVESTQESFVLKPPKKSKLIQLQLDLILQVIKVRLEEADAAKTARDLKAKKQQIMDLIVKKENDALGETSLEDLKKQLEQLAA
jgi:hypothetical protein